jgi:hypothetical protein
VRHTRQTVVRMAIGVDAVEAAEISYADVFVVVREGEDEPGTTDWEVTLRTAADRRIDAGRYEMAMESVDGSVLRGAAVLRFSDGRRHLFRGDDVLTGFVDEGPTTG